MWSSACYIQWDPKLKDNPRPFPKKTKTKTFHQKNKNREIFQTKPRDDMLKAAIGMLMMR